MNTLLKPSWLTKTKKVICPKCLTTINTEYIEANQNNCPVEIDGMACDFHFPVRYLQNADSAPPLFVQVFGWTSHGKTVFLYALLLLLLDMRKLWPRYVHQPITQLDIELEQMLRGSLRYGWMPDPTQVRTRQQNEVYIRQLDDILRYGSRSLIIMDHAGEMFKNFDVPAAEMPFLIKTMTTFMLISIPRLKSEGRGEAMDQLLNIYLETMLRNKVDFRREKRKLVVVLTMADLIGDLPSNLRNYLIGDDVWSRLRSGKADPFTLESMSAYIERMHWASDEIRYWLENDSDGAPGGATMVGLIGKYNIDARYTLISATGYDVEAVQKERAAKQAEEGETPDAKNDLGIPLAPRRILDPFLWALEFQSR